ncbi:MAG: DUF1919 domain-containing protein, partial [Bacteroidales bacterium]|nr:DUF1919 domain-containing protein [Bacteroidales bacterium]
MDLYPTVICNDCTGGMILHDLHMPFNSPFINACMSDEDYLKLLGNLREYMSIDLTDDTKGNRYPIGLLGDIRIHFMHNDTFEQAKKNWQRRLKRVNYEKIVVIGSCIDTQAKDLGERFYNLPYKHKVLLHNDMSIKIPCSVYIKGCTNKKNKLLNHSISIIINIS